MSFPPPYWPPDLSSEIGRWLSQSPSWYLRPASGSDDYFAATLYLPSLRHATAEEVAAEIAGSPALRQALTLLASPAGQAIEEAVARLWLPGWQATLLTEALTRAWKTVLDENRPAWQRANVLIGAGAALGLLGLAIWTGRGAA